MKKLLIFLIMILSISLNAQQWKWYLTSSAGQPWGSVSNITAMNTAFGAAWSQGTFQGTPVNAVFHPSVCLVYLDGGSMNATAMENYILANSAFIQAWVFNGGRLFFNAAPNQGLNQNWFFGGVFLNYNVGPYSTPGYAATVPAHPIYIGPAPVTTTVHTGNYYCHGYITGPGITTIINNTVSAWTGTQPPMPKTILASKPWGAGMCLFGSMTNTSFHLPNPSATNLRANMLSWLYVCCISPTISVAATQSVICSGGTTTLIASGAGIGGTYTWSPGNIISPTIVVSPTVTTIYTAAATNSANCAGSLTFQILVNPTPTVIPVASPTIVCRNSPVTFSVGVPAGTPTYSWFGPGGWTSAFQSPLISQAQSSNTGIYTVTAISTFSNGVCAATGTTNLVVINTNTITSNNPTVCLNSPINLTSTIVAPASILWQGPNVYTSNVQNPVITNATATNAGIYTVTATFSVPGQTVICQTQSQSTVSMVITSPVTVSIPSNVCQNTNPVITSSAVGTPTWSWTGPNFVSSVSTNTLSNIQPVASGIYSVTAYWSIGQTTCSIGNFGQISVVAMATPSVTSPVQVCYPAAVTLTSFAGSAVSYSWQSSGGLNFNGLQNLTFTQPTGSVNGTWTVTAQFTNGQLNCFQSATTSVLVNPILPFTLEPYKLVCFNSSHQINGPLGATSYTWIGPNNFNSNTQNLYINPVQPLNSGTYTLELNLGPCKTIGTTQLDVTTPITFTKTPTSKTICKGDTINVMVGANGGSGVYAYNWNPGTGLGSTNGNFQIANPQGTTIYNITVYDVACPNYTINTSFAINVNSYPVPQLIFENGCEPLCLFLDSKIGNEINSISWNFGNNKILDGDKINVCLNAGIYNLKTHTYGKNGCNGVTNFESINVYHKPGVDFTWNPITPNNISGNRVTFYPTVQWGTQNIYSWNFFNEKEIYENTKYPVVIYENQGNFPIVLIATNEWGCKDTVIKSIKIEEDYNCYIPNAFTPNSYEPNNQFFPVIYGVKEYSLSIFDRWGELIFDGKNEKWDGKYKGVICQDGTYVYRVIVIKNNNTRKEYVGQVTLLK